ncbi:MAG TPA: hypothetical protein VFO41_02595 [Alphaproteobacteria bacterium]|nr:hypothetical protein [Alphaproteobacteria bacterium]
MTERSFNLSFASALSGFLIWAVHFLFVYIFTALACARRFADIGVFGVGIVPLAVGLATIVAAGSLAAICLVSLRPGPAKTPSAHFLRRLTALVAGLSFVAVVWAGVPTLMVPVCR